MLPFCGNPRALSLYSEHVASNCLFSIFSLQRDESRHHEPQDPMPSLQKCDKHKTEQGRQVQTGLLQMPKIVRSGREGFGPD